MLALPAKLNIEQANAAVAALAPAAAQSNGALVVDAGALTEFDSAAIATLLELRRRAPGRSFSVSGAPKAMVDLAALYGVAELLGFS